MNNKKENKKLEDPAEGLYKFHFDCGRDGELIGLFIANVDEVNRLVESKKEIHFGHDILGKHSEISGPLVPYDYTLVTTDKDIIDIVRKNKLEVGFNPVETYIEYCRDQEIDSIFDEDGEDDVD